VGIPSLFNNRNGFSLLEILLAAFILGVAIAPMINAITPAVRSTDDNEKTTVLINQVRSTLNRIAALDYATLDSNAGNPADLVSLFGSVDEAAKENFQLRGTTYTPTVSIIDGSGGVGGLLELTVSVERVSLKTLKAES